MPRTRSLAWSELKIGIVAIVALAVAATLIFTVGNQGGFFWQRYHLKTTFDDIRGLKSGAVVRVAGVEVGKVTNVDFSGAEVEVVMEVSEKMKDKIRTTSRASIGSLSLLGEALVDITASTEGEALPDWGIVQASRSGGQITDVAASASEGLEQATQLLKEIRGGKGTIGRLVTDEALYKEMQAFVDAAGQVATNLNSGNGTIGALMKNPAAYRSLQSSLQNLDDITKRMNAGEGTLGRFLKDEALAKSLSSASANVETLTGKLNRGEGTAGKLMNDPALYDRLNSMADRLEQLTTRLSQGEGTAGQLLRDNQLYENMNGAVAELRSLVADIRKDPRKYLQVRVSIF